MKLKSPLTVVMVLLIGALVVPNVISLIRGPAPTPDIFSAGYTLTQGSEISQQTGKPMLVLATADWCAPCQQLKRATLTDPGVAAWISKNTVPVYLEDGVNPTEIASLGVRAYPTTMLVQGGKVVSAIEGAAGPGRFIDSLQGSLPPPSQ